MPATKVADKDFLLMVMPLLTQNKKVTYRELAEASGLKISGVQYKLNKLGIRKPDSGFEVPADIWKMIRS